MMASTNRVTADAVQITGVLDMRKHQIVGLETDLSLYPLDEDQGATKKYVDAARVIAENSLDRLVDNGSF